MRSEAQKRADKKYKSKTYKTFTVNAKIDQYDIITDYCNSHGISKSQLLLLSAMYCIDNNIDVSNSNDR